MTQTMRLSETKQGDLIKFSKKTKVDWYIAYRDRSAIEMWSNNDTTRTIRPSSKSWDKTIKLLQRTKECHY